MLHWFVTRLAVAVAAELHRTGAIPQPSAPSPAKTTSAPRRRLCHVREVQYMNGTIATGHSQCHGPQDVDALWTEDALVIKDTAHDWVTQ